MLPLIRKQFEHEIKMPKVICNFMRSLNQSKRSSFVRYVSTSQFKLTEDDVEEVKIPMPWGHIAGKQWGSRDRPTILCLHGWQDNANTFNTLIPQLPAKFSYLAVDLPGHGFSSHISEGCFYQIYDVVITIRKLQLYFDWAKLPLLGHSFGAACSFVFSSLFPDSVDFFVAIDNIKPLSKNPAQDVKDGSKNIEKMLSLDCQSLSNAPLYSREDLLQRWIKGSNNSLTEKSCQVLMERGTIIDNGLFKLTRDSRLKTSLAPHFSQKEILKLAESITCPVLFLKADGSSYFEKKEDVLDVISIIKGKSRHFEEYILPGTHHVHLNNPEAILKLVESITCPVLFLKADGSFYFEKKEYVLNVISIIKGKSRHFAEYILPGIHHVHLNNPELVAPLINSFIKAVKVN